MKVKNFYYLLVVGFLLFLQGCDKTADREVVEIKQEKHLLSRDNFISLAKYHFSKSSNTILKSETLKIDNNSKFRSYPGSSNKQRLQEGSSILKVSYVAPFDKYIESIKLESADRCVTVVVDNSFVIISLFEGDTLLKSDTQSRAKFNSFGLEKIGEML
jgi:hypothetical protein